MFKLLVGVENVIYMEKGSIGVFCGFLGIVVFDRRIGSWLFCGFGDLVEIWR